MATTPSPQIKTEFQRTHHTLLQEDEPSHRVNVIVRYKWDSFPKVGEAPKLDFVLEISGSALDSQGEQHVNAPAKTASISIAPDQIDQLTVRDFEGFAKLLDVERKKYDAEFKTVFEAKTRTEILPGVVVYCYAYHGKCFVCQIEGGGVFFNIPHPKDLTALLQALKTARSMHQF